MLLFALILAPHAAIVLAALAAMMAVGATLIIVPGATLTTVGNGTLTYTLLEGQVITRSGPTGNFTDTTDTLATIVSKTYRLTGGASWLITYINTTSHTATIAAGSGCALTANGLTVIPANSVAQIGVVLGPNGSSFTITVLNRFAYN